MMEVYAGHVVHCFMLRPCALACLRGVYDFMRDSRGCFRRFGSELMRELATIRGLLVVASSLALSAPYLEGRLVVLLVRDPCRG